MELLSVQGLCKSYPSFRLENISFSLPAGYIMGYIGQNGAGKTTTLDCITHLIRPEAGEITIGGISFQKDPVSYRERIGYIGDSSYFPPLLTVSDIRTILADFYPTFRREDFDRYVRNWKLPLKKKIRTFSRGMKVKLMFASVLSRDTRLLILDEATNGLDPLVRREVLQLLQNYVESGERSVLFSTHILEDLEDIADYIYFINDGQEIFCGEKDELLERYVIVKGDREFLASGRREGLLGIEEHAYGFEALFDLETGRPDSALTVEKATVDRIVIHRLVELAGKNAAMPL